MTEPPDNRRDGPGHAAEQSAAWAKLIAMVAIVLALPLGAWLLHRQMRPPTPAERTAAAERRKDLLRRGIEALKAGDNPAALARFRTAAEIAPPNTDAHNLLGMTHFMRGEFDDAAKALRHSLAVDPTSDAPKLWLYLALARGGDAMASGVLPVGDDPIADMHRGKGAPEDILRFRSGRALTNLAERYFHIGQRHLLLGDRDAAREAFIKAAAIRDDTPEALAAKRELLRFATTTDNVNKDKVFYRGEWLTADELMAKLGYVKRGAAWVPAAQARAAAPALAIESEPPPGKVDYLGRWVTPQQRDAMIAASAAATAIEAPTQGALPADDDPDAAMRARGLIKHGSLWVTEAQLKAIDAREKQIAEARQEREAAQANATGHRGPFDPAEAAWTLDDFSRLHAWRVMGWGNPCRVSAETHDGRSALAVAIEGGVRINAAIRRTLSANLKSRDALTLEIANAGRSPFSAALALETDAYYETKPLPVAPGKRATLTYYLNADTFKSEAGGWNYTDSLRASDTLRAVLVVFYAEGPAAAVLHRLAAVDEGDRP